MFSVEAPSDCVNTRPELRQAASERGAALTFTPEQVTIIQEAATKLDRCVREHNEVIM